MNLQNHIRQENADASDWVAEDPTNRWVGFISDDLAHWESRGITTVDQYEHYMLVTSVHDLHKDICGYRMHWDTLNKMSNDELSRIFEEYSKR